MFAALNILVPMPALLLLIVIYWNYLFINLDCGIMSNNANICQYMEVCFCHTTAARTVQCSAVVTRLNDDAIINHFKSL